EPQPEAFYKKLAEMAPRVEDLWDGDWRLRIERRARDTAAFDYESLPFPELIAHFKSMVNDIGENMVLMFQASYLVNYSRSRLAEFCAEQAGSAAERIVTDLLQGFPSASLDSGVALWDV